MKRLPRPIKNLRASLLLALGLSVTGCIHLPSPYGEQLNATSDAYRSIGRGLTHAEIVAKLGDQKSTHPDGASVWETRFDRLNYVSLAVKFDARGRSREVQFTRAKGIETPGYAANSVFSTKR